MQKKAPKTVRNNNHHYESNAYFFCRTGNEHRRDFGANEWYDRTAVVDL